MTALQNSAGLAFEYEVECLLGLTNKVICIVSSVDSFAFDPNDAS